MEKVCFSNDENLMEIILRKIDIEYILPDENGSESSEDKSNIFGVNLLDSDEDSDDSGEILHYYHVKVTNQNELLEQFKQIGNYFCYRI